MNDTLTVAVFQPRAGAPAGARLERTARAIAAAAERGADLILFPELWLSGYGAGEEMAALAEPADGPFSAAVAGLARQHGVAVCYGYPEKDGDRIYNAAAVIDPDGHRIANHRKRVLPTAYEKRLFTTGRDATLFKLGAWRLGLVICYEVEFPETVRHAAAAGAGIILAPTALGAAWPVVAHHVIPARAFENGVFIAYADWAGSEPGQAYFGGSRIAGPDGRILTSALRDEDLIVARLDRLAIAKVRERLPYLDDAPALRH